MVDLSDFGADNTSAVGVYNVPWLETWVRSTTLHHSWYKQPADRTKGRCQSAASIDAPATCYFCVAGADDQDGGRVAGGDGCL